MNISDVKRITLNCINRFRYFILVLTFLLISVITIITEINILSSELTSVQLIFLIIIPSIAIIGSFFGGLNWVWHYYSKTFFPSPSNTQKSILETLEDIKVKVSQQPELLTQLEKSEKSCEKYLHDFLAVFSELLPLKLPGIEFGLPLFSPDEILTSEEFLAIKNRVENVSNLCKNLNSENLCFDFSTDWKSQRILFLIANFWYFAEEYELAIEFYKILKKYSPQLKKEDEEPSYIEINLLHNLGTSLFKINLKESLEVFKELLEKNPNDPFALFNISYVLAELGRFEESLKAINDSIRIYPKRSEAWVNKAANLGSLNKHIEALEAIEEAISLNPNACEAWISKCSALDHLNRTPEALDACEKAIKINPNHYMAWYNKAIVLNKLKKNEEALEAIDIAFGLVPKDYRWMAQFWSLKANILNELHSYQLALKAGVTALSLDENHAEAYYQKGLALLGLEKLNESLTFFNKSLILNPNDSRAFVNKGIALAKLRKHLEALESIDTAIKIDSNNFHTWITRGLVLDELERMNEALESFQRSVELNPNCYEAWDQMGICLGELGELERSISAFEKAIVLNPSRYEAWHNLGISLYKLSRFKEAIIQFDKAISINESYVYSIRYKAYSLIELNRYDEAIVSLKILLETNKGEPMDYYNLASCFSLLNNLNECCEMLKIAMELDFQLKNKAINDLNFNNVKQSVEFLRIVNIIE